jgi:hypothetical protein
MNNDLIEEVFDAWVADRKLSRRKLAFLETAHNQTMEVMLSSCGLSPDVAPGGLCSELDLPQGSYWCQLVAELLDHLKPLEEQPSRLVELNDALVELGLLEEQTEG